MKIRSTIAAGFLGVAAILSMPLVTQAQGVIQGGEEERPKADAQPVRLAQRLAAPSVE